MEADLKRLETRNATKQRHAGMRCRTRKLKLQVKSHSGKDYMHRLFTEARWFTNQIVASRKRIDPSTSKKTAWNNIPTTSNTVQMRNVFGEFEDKPLMFLSSQMKQGLKTRIQANEKSIIKNVKEGNIKHGELHFTSKVCSVPLKQYGNTYQFSDDFKKVTFQNSGLWFKVFGYKQLLGDGIEFANAVLMEEYGDYYLIVTFYEPWDEEMLAARASKPAVGLDFGIMNHITTSDGTVYSWCFEESERLKKAQAANQTYRDWSKKYYGYALNSKRQMEIIHREYIRLAHQKQDAINKFVGELERLYGWVAIQNEGIANWKDNSSWSGEVHHSIMGGIMKRLKQGHSTLIVDKWERSTGVCPGCGYTLEQKPGLDERSWECPECGVSHDRDVAAARVLLGYCLQYLDEFEHGAPEDDSHRVRFGDQTVIRQLSPEAQVL